MVTHFSTDVKHSAFAETHEPAGYYDLYAAEFELEGIDYEIIAEQMELDELIKVVASIIYEEKEIHIQAVGKSSN